MEISYHVSHEQFAPGELLSLVQHAESAGFSAAFCSDHLQPWAPQQGHSGHAWAWLGAAMQATSRVRFGTITVPGGWRYHPVILAQAVATLGEMFPGRMPWIACGSGEAVNEHVVGAGWPEKPERNERLAEGVQILRRLLAGETVTHHGRLRAVEAKIWSRPEKPTLLLGAAVTEATAEFAGSWADGLLTVSAKPDQLAKVIAAFRRGGGREKPVQVKVGLSWAPTEEQALQQAYEQWRFNSLGGEVNWDLRRPADFVQASRHVRPDDLRDDLRISSDPAWHCRWLQEMRDAGAGGFVLHNVGHNQRDFIDVFAREVLPAFA